MRREYFFVLLWPLLLVPLLMLRIRPGSTVDRERIGFEILRETIAHRSEGYPAQKEFAENLSRERSLPIGNSVPRLVAGRWWRTRPPVRKASATGAPESESRPYGCPYFGPLPCFETCLDASDAPSKRGCESLTRPALAFLENDAAGRPRILSIARVTKKRSVILSEAGFSPPLPQLAGGSLPLISFSSCGDGLSTAEALREAASELGQAGADEDLQILLLYRGAAGCARAQEYPEHLSRLRDLVSAASAEMLSRNAVRLHVFYEGAGAHEPLYPSLEGIGCMGQPEMRRRGYLTFLSRPFLIPKTDPNLNDFLELSARPEGYFQEAAYLEFLARSSGGAWVPLRRGCPVIHSPLIHSGGAAEPIPGGWGGGLGDYCEFAKTSTGPRIPPYRLSEAQQQLSRTLVVSHPDLVGAGVTDEAGRLLCEPVAGEPAQRVFEAIRQTLSDGIEETLRSL